MKKENGCIRYIITLIIFLLFSLTVYVCLEVFEIIDVPEEYSAVRWIENHFDFDIKIENDQITIVTNNTDDNNEDTNDGKKKSIIQQIIQYNSQDSDDEYNKLQNALNVEEVTSESNTEEKDIYSKWYYYQLDEYGKEIYDGLEKNIDNMKSGVYNIDYGTKFNDLLQEESGVETLRNSFQTAINAFKFDRPEIFYIDFSKLCISQIITTKFMVIREIQITIGPEDEKNSNYYMPGYNSVDDVNNAIQNFENKKQQIISGLSGDTENQIKYIHNYLINNVSYDSSISKDNTYNSYGAIIEGCAVCQGYACAFKTIMDELGIKCIVVCGKALNSENNTGAHAWNDVRINDTWYAIDCTFDDPVSTSNNEISEKEHYKYYLKGSNTFFKNHFEDGNIAENFNFYYPTISENDY